MRLPIAMLMAAALLAPAAPMWAQAYPPPPPPPTYAPQQLDELVAPIALYPDPLLAQVLTASTFSNQIPDADGWARAHSYLTGDALARAINEDNLPWDPSVLALLPFPSVLDHMAGDMGWTQELGNAVLADRAGVMDAIQDQRQRAMSYGYLRTNQYYRVVPNPGDIEVLPVNPAYIYVPYYDPNIVFFRPRAGFFAGGAISFGPAITIGAAFAPWGWGGVSLGWRNHAIIINNRPWERGWVNRDRYVHPYPALRPRTVPAVPRMEHHELREFHEPEHRPAERGRDGRH
jgi:hypothetical protein